MTGYNSRERRGLLIMLVVIMVITASAFIMRSCQSGKVNSESDGLKIATEISSTPSDSIENIKSGKRSSKKRGGSRSGRKRKSTLKKVTDDYPYRDILSDTIHVGTKEE